MTKKAVLTDLTFKEFAAVDEGAHEDARAVILKRKYSGKGGKKRKKDGEEEEVAKSAALTTTDEGHQHTLTTVTYDGTKIIGDTSWADDHYHSFLHNPETGEITIAMANGHTHEVDSQSVVKAASAEAPTNDSNTSAGTGKPDMADTPTAQDLQKQLEEVTKRAERAESIAALDDGHRAYFKGLNEGGQDAFLALDADGRKAEVAKATEADPVVYTTAAGEEIRKSAGSTLIEMAKRLDKQTEELRKSQERAELIELTKRAEDLGHLPGAVEAKVAVLKALDGIPNEEHRTASLEMLKAANAANSGAFERKGATGKVAGTKTFSELKKSYKDANPKATDVQAINEILKTKEGYEAYQAYEAGEGGLNGCC